MKYIIVFISVSFQLFGAIDQSVIPFIDSLYSQDCNTLAIQNAHSKLRVMTFNMLYNVKSAEEKLPLKHRWESRKFRLLEYLDYAKADIINSQELQVDQVDDLMAVLGSTYSYYGLKTREAEGRSDINAIFFKVDRFELIDAQTIYYEYEGGNAFTYGYFNDKLQDRKFAVINTKLSWGITWGAMSKRRLEATKLNQFVMSLPKDEPILLMGDFNTLYFLDGKSVVHVLTENLEDAKTQSIFGLFGPSCSITNSSILFTPFTGPELNGVILDRILVNERICVLASAIDAAKVNGEFASDHLPVFADILFK